MDVLPLNSMSETTRQSQYLAAVTRQSDERKSRSQELLNPHAPGTREEWNAAQVAIHKRRFPFSDNLTTLMFIVANALSEAHRERLASSLFLQGVDVTAYSFEAVRAVFVELFCKPKSSMDNPSLTVNNTAALRAEPSS